MKVLWIDALVSVGMLSLVVWFLIELGKIVGRIGAFLATVN